ncbi:unnamed protein product [Caenorhabditis auriculariae]|uniref:arginase n=1 Tax=Caenorhabditis auriculariae TaxID=2777116 RepID=A0A8S1H2X7_9PELO|nr:unnamed protein product [Caenorhabditis auriculariae]
MNRVVSIFFLAQLISTTIVDLNSVLPGVNLRTSNLTLIFKNAQIEDGRLTFDQIQSVNADGRPVDVSKENLEVSQKEKVVDYKDLVESIDYTIDPCIDFYGHVCNGWKAKHPIPFNESQISHSQLISNKLTQRIQEILTKSKKAPGREYELMYIYYQKCVEHTENPDNSGFKTLLEKLTKIRTLDVSRVTDWLIVMKSQSLFYEFSVAPDEYNSSKNILHVSPVGPVLKYDAYFNPIYMHEYNGLRTFLFQLLQLLSFDDENHQVFKGTPDDAFRRVESFLRVDQTIAKIQQETRNNFMDITVKMRELPNVLHSVDWDRYFRSIIPGDLFENLQNSEIRISDSLAVARTEELIAILPNKTLQDYLEWKAVFHYGEFMDQRYQDLLSQYELDVTGVKNKDRIVSCIEATNSLFPDLVGHQYVLKYFEKNTRVELQEIVLNIKNEFLKLLDENTWMDEKTKNRARLKTKAIGEYIGYNEDIFNQTLIARKYANLTFSEFHNFREITDSVTSWAQMRSLTLLNKSNKKEEFDFPAAQINAFYDPSHNNIAILAGILFTPYFNSTFPRAMNYGSIGVVIGHEMTHGFDNYGALFDENGNKKNWWGKETFDNYERRKLCIEEQYDQVFIEDLGVHVDGKRTLGENIADNGGMRLALGAMNKATKQEEVSVSGLEEYTPNQQFFLNYAYSWCGNTRRQALLNDVATNVHSPDVQRVNVLLANQPEFAQAFHYLLSTFGTEERRPQRDQEKKRDGRHINCRISEITTFHRLSTFNMRRTTALAKQVITAIGCANGQAGRELGCEKAVEIIKNSQFLDRMRVELRWGPVVDEISTGRQQKALLGVKQTCRQLAYYTKEAIENKEELLVLGGDHSCAIGTWSGVSTALRPAGDLGLIWVDAHMDAHTPETSGTGNIHGMPVAHLLGFGDKSLVHVGDRMPKILPHNLCMVGIRDYESAEQEFLEKLGVRIFYADEVHRRGITDVMQEAQYLVSRNTIGYGLSIDLDGFDVRYAPAVGTPAANGINALEFVKAMLTIDLTKLVATEIVEFLPRLDDENKTSEKLVASLVEYIYITKEFQLKACSEISERVSTVDVDRNVRVSHAKMKPVLDKMKSRITSTSATASADVPSTSDLRELKEVVSLFSNDFMLFQCSFQQVLDYVNMASSFIDDPDVNERLIAGEIISILSKKLIYANRHEWVLEILIRQLSSAKSGRSIVFCLTHLAYLASYFDEFPSDKSVRVIELLTKAIESQENIVQTALQASFPSICFCSRNAPRQLEILLKVAFQQLEKSSGAGARCAAKVLFVICKNNLTLVPQTFSHCLDMAKMVFFKGGKVGAFIALKLLANASFDLDHELLKEALLLALFVIERQGGEVVHEAFDLLKALIAAFPSVLNSFSLAGKVISMTQNGVVDYNASRNSEAEDPAEDIIDPLMNAELYEEQINQQPKIEKPLEPFRIFDHSDENGSVLKKCSLIIARRYLLTGNPGCINDSARISIQRLALSCLYVVSKFANISNLVVFGEKGYQKMTEVSEFALLDDPGVCSIATKLSLRLYINADTFGCQLIDIVFEKLTKIAETSLERLYTRKALIEAFTDVVNHKFNNRAYSHDVYSLVVKECREGFDSTLQLSCANYLAEMTSKHGVEATKFTIGSSLFSLLAQGSSSSGFAAALSMLPRLISGEGRENQILAFNCHQPFQMRLGVSREVDLTNKNHQEVAKNLERFFGMLFAGESLNCRELLPNFGDIVSCLADVFCPALFPNIYRSVMEPLTQAYIFDVRKPVHISGYLRAFGKIIGAFLIESTKGKKRPDFVEEYAETIMINAMRVLNLYYALVMSHVSANATAVTNKKVVVNRNVNDFSCLIGTAHTPCKNKKGESSKFSEAECLQEAYSAFQGSCNNYFASMQNDVDEKFTEPLKAALECLCSLFEVFFPEPEGFNSFHRYVYDEMLLYAKTLFSIVPSEMTTFLTQMLKLKTKSSLCHMEYSLSQSYAEKFRLHDENPCWINLQNLVMKVRNPEGFDNFLERGLFLPELGTSSQKFHSTDFIIDQLRDFFGRVMSLMNRSEQNMIQVYNLAKEYVSGGLPLETLDPEGVLLRKLRGKLSNLCEVVVVFLKHRVMANEDVKAMQKLILVSSESKMDKKHVTNALSASTLLLSALAENPQNHFLWKVVHEVGPRCWRAAPAATLEFFIYIHHLFGKKEPSLSDILTKKFIELIELEEPKENTFFQLVVFFSKMTEALMKIEKFEISKIMEKFCEGHVSVMLIVYHLLVSTENGPGLFDLKVEWVEKLKEEGAAPPFDRIPWVRDFFSTYLNFSPDALTGFYFSTLRNEPQNEREELPDDDLPMAIADLNAKKSENSSNDWLEIVASIYTCRPQCLQALARSPIEKMIRVHEQVAKSGKGELLNFYCRFLQCVTLELSASQELDLPLYEMMKKNISRLTRYLLDGDNENDESFYRKYGSKQECVELKIKIISFFQKIPYSHHIDYCLTVSDAETALRNITVENCSNEQFMTGVRFILRDDAVQNAIKTEQCLFTVYSGILKYLTIDKRNYTRLTLKGLKLTFNYPPSAEKEVAERKLSEATLREAFIVAQHVMGLISSPDTNESDLIKSVWITLLRHPILYGLAMIPVEAVRNGWQIQTEWKPHKLFGVSLISVPELSRDTDVLKDFKFRASWLGWLHRSQFEELFMSFFGVLASMPVGEEVAAVQDYEERSERTAVAFLQLCELLLGAHAFPLGGDRSSQYIVKHRERSGPFFKSRLLMELAEVKSKLTSVEVKSAFSQNIEMLRNTTEEYNFGQLSVLSLWNLCGVLSAETASSDLVPHPKQLSSSMSAFLLNTTHDLDTASHLRSMIDICNHWLSKGVQDLAPNVLYAITVTLTCLSDLFDTESYYIFMLNSFQAIHRLGALPNNYKNGYVLYGIIKCVAVLGLEEASITDKQICGYIGEGLGGSTAVIEMTLDAVLILFQSTFVDQLPSVISLCSNFVMFLKGIPESKLESLRCRLWAIVFRILEEPIAYGTKKELLQMVKESLVDARLSTVERNSLTSGVEALICHSRNFVHHFYPTVVYCLKNYVTHRALFEYIVRIALVCAAQDSQIENGAHEDSLTETVNELLSINDRCTVQHTKILENALPAFMRLTYGFEKAIQKLLERIDFNEPWISDPDLHSGKTILIAVYEIFSVMRHSESLQDRSKILSECIEQVKAIISPYVESDDLHQKYLCHALLHASAKSIEGSYRFFFGLDFYGNKEMINKWDLSADSA